MSWNIFSDRAPGYQAIAEKLSLPFVAEDKDKSLLNQHKTFKLFQRGISNKIKFILYGNTPLSESFQAFEYQYTISTGKSSATIHQNVFSVTLSMPLPSFILRPEGLFQKIGKWFGLKDINFEQYPEFSDHYLLKAIREEAIRTLFNDQILGFLNYELGWWIECNGSRIIYYKNGKRMNEEMVEPFMQVAQTMHGLLVGKQEIE